MEKTTSYKPKDFHTITPYLTVNGAGRLIQFLKETFDAQELGIYKRDGSDQIMHAVVKIGDSFIEMSDATSEWKATTAALHVYVPNVDEVFKKAVRAGAKPVLEPRDQFYGDRESFVQDEFGNNWYISTHTKDVSEEEMKAHAVEG